MVALQKTLFETESTSQRTQTNYDPAMAGKIWPTVRIEQYEVGGHRLHRIKRLKTIESCRIKKNGQPYAVGYASLEANIQPADYPKPKHNNQVLIVALGMGTDSVAMLVEMKNRGIRPDIVQWADTGTEKLETYRYVKVIQKWLKDNDFPPLLIVRKRCPKALHRSLFEQLWKTEQLPSPAFHKNHSCSVKWKLEPQRDYHTFLTWMHDGIAKTAIGFSTEETNRKVHGCAEAVGFSKEEEGRRSYQIKDTKGYVTYYPLQEWNITRTDSVAIIEAEGLPQPGKSACVICPMYQRCEIVALRTPEQNAAFALEDRAEAGGKLKKIVGLRKGKNEKWSEWIKREDPVADEKALVAVGLVSDLAS